MADSFWRVADTSPSNWPTQRVLTEPRSAAIAELISVITDCTIAKAQKVVETITLQSTLFSDVAAWNRFKNCSDTDLQSAGLTAKQSARLLASVEFGKRVFASSGEVRIILDDPSKAAELVRYEIGDSEIEKFAVILLDIKHRALAVQTIAVGGKTECTAEPAQIFGSAIKHGAARMIIAHNHPSGDTAPSSQDIDLTELLLKAAEMMGIPILDHIIVAGDRFTSLRQTTDLWHGFKN